MKLKPEEADFLCWQEAYYMDNVRKNTKRAARFAWRVACTAFPRLKKFTRPTP